MKLRWNACPVCKWIHFKRFKGERGLCDHCREQLWTRRSPIVRMQNGYVIRSLFGWNKGDPPGLKWWVHSLKYKEHEGFWRDPAHWALTLLQGSHFMDTLVVPVPTSSRANPNHARGFARSLATFGSWTMMDLLECDGKPAPRQKRLGRTERWARRFIMTQTPDRSYSRKLIVDDVVTTGATVEAAFQALGRPPGCEVWCLLDRRPCGAPQPLL